jgi:N-acetylmuramoyl-L-alanine amidase
VYNVIYYVVSDKNILNYFACQLKLPKIKNHNVTRLVSLLVLLCLTSFTYAGGSGQGAAVHTLVIDPGHGGMDPGAIGPGGHHEADLALAVSLKFGKMVQEAFPDVRIVYTRTTDKFVSLADRADTANKVKADLFICIHLNSAVNKEAYGTSTYVLGLHRTDDNLEIAKRENAVIDLEADKNKKSYDFNPNSPEGHIIMSMKQNAFLDQSILIASKIEDELAVLAKRKSRGVKQAGFWVLYKTAMPSLLAEIGFISNPTEEQYLASVNGQTNIATAIFKAFRAYKNEIEGTTTAEKKTEETTDTLLAASPGASQPVVNKPVEKVAAKTPTQEIPVKVATDKPAEVKPTPAKEEHTWVPDTNLIVTKAEPTKAIVAKKEEPIAKKEEPTTSTYRSITELAVVVKDTVKSEPYHTEKKLVPIREVDEPVAHAEEVKSYNTEKPTPRPSTPAKAISDTVKQTLQKVVNTSKQVIAIQQTDSKPAAPKKDTLVQVKTTKQELKPLAVKKDTIPAKPVKSQQAAKAESKPAEKTAKSAEKWVTPADKANTNKPTQEPTAAKEEPELSKNHVVFRVQLIAARNQPKDYEEWVNTFGLIHREELSNGVVRYMAGQFYHYNAAKKIMDLAKSKGFKEAFIIGYKDGQRLDIKKTIEMGAENP